MKKFYTVYQITNKQNGMIYIGCHATDNLNDTYFASGVYINRVVKKHGRKIFKREILFTFANKEAMLAKELELVNEDFIQRKDTYNLIMGGEFNTTGFITVKDKDGNTQLVSVNDPRYLSGELKHLTSGMVIVKDKNGKQLSVDKNDPRYLSSELISIHKNKVRVKDKTGKTFSVSKDDLRYLSGELKFHCTDKKHSEKTKLKMSKSQHGKQKGNKNSQYGTCWIYNLELKENKKIKKEDIESYLNKGWLKGRKIKF